MHFVCHYAVWLNDKDKIHFTAMSDILWKLAKNVKYNRKCYYIKSIYLGILHYILFLPYLLHKFMYTLVAVFGYFKTG